METHDPMCSRPMTSILGVCDCDLITKVRADERHKVETEGTDITRWHQGLVLTYLHAKVEALRGFNRDGDGEEWVERADVLALLDEAGS